MPILIFELLRREVSPLQVRYTPPVYMVARDDMVCSVDVDDLVRRWVQLGQLQGLYHRVPSRVVGSVLEVVEDEEVVLGVQDDGAGVLRRHRQASLHYASQTLLLRVRKYIVNQGPRNLSISECKFCNLTRQGLTWFGKRGFTSMRSRLGSGCCRDLMLVFGSLVC